MRLRLAVLSMFISEKPRSQMEVSMAMQPMMAARSRMLYNEVGDSLSDSWSKETLVELGVLELAEGGVEHHKALEPRPLAHHSSFITAQVVVEGAKVVEEHLNVQVAVILNRRRRATSRLQSWRRAGGVDDTCPLVHLSTCPLGV